MRRLSTAILAAAALVVGCLLLWSPAAPAGAAVSSTSGATTPSPTTEPTLEVVKISGLLDPVLADFLSTSIDQAQRGGSIGLLLQVNSAGSVVSAARLRALAAKLHDSRVPIVAWVGPSGSRAEGGMAQLLATVTSVGIAPGSNIGRTGDVVVPLDLWAPAFRTNRARLHDGLVGAGAGKSSGVAPRDALVLKQILLQVPGFRVKAGRSADGTRVGATQLVFSQLPTGSGVMHTVASPAVAYLLFVIGLGLILFELFTAGVGIAGLVGAGCFILGSYGLWVLPVRGLAIGLVVASMVAFAVDVQTGVPRVWTGVGSALFIVGSFSLYQGLGTPWLAVVGGVVGMVVFMVFGMPGMTRTRFSTPTIDREWLVGLTGESVSALSPEGVVRVGGGMWAGRTMGDVALGQGAAVRVVGVDGTVVEVEVDDD